MAVEKNHKTLERMSKSSKEGSILTNLWRKILIENKQTGNINTLIGEYLSRENIDYGDGKTKKKSSINDNVFSEDMTIRVFMDLIFNVLRIRVVRIKIDLLWPTGKESTTQIRTTPRAYTKKYKFRDEREAEANEQNNNRNV